MIDTNAQKFLDTKSFAERIGMSEQAVRRRCRKIVGQNDPDWGKVKRFGRKFLIPAPKDPDVEKDSAELVAAISRLNRELERLSQISEQRDRGYQNSISLLTSEIHRLNVTLNKQQKDERREIGTLIGGTDSPT